MVMVGMSSQLVPLACGGVPGHSGMVWMPRKALSVPATPIKTAAAATAVGAAAGIAVSVANRSKKGSAKAAHETTSLDDLEK